ncbi:murein biosynthesis integral membrane protein MurJ [Streptomyces sp. NPDC048521]|uniref:murein biosynthesis integral membrane protein MurJ n=1 Tax=Streptomyces sp. NPDC048521 TaxID=3365566 RepID=UPI0037136AD9
MTAPRTSHGPAGTTPEAVEITSPTTGEAPDPNTDPPPAPAPGAVREPPTTTIASGTGTGTGIANDTSTSTSQAALPATRFTDAGRTTSSGHRPPDTTGIAVPTTHPTDTALPTARPTDTALPTARPTIPDEATPPPHHAPIPHAEPGGEGAAGRAVGFGHVPPTRRFLARAALLTASLSVASAVLGLVRDQSLARLFGAGRDTDAFLVAWTVPEFAATLLIEEGLAFALIPAFSAALARRAQGAPGDPVRSLVAGTLPRLALAFAAVGALLTLAAPQFVAALAPGLPDPGLAADCTRLTASCVLSFGLAGYCSAALRAHRRFLAPAAIYLAYNLGIITAMYALGGHWGVRAAAFGVAAGGCLMTLIQLPSLVRELRHRPSGSPVAPGAVGEARPMDVPLLATVLLFALCRQSQVLIERFLAAGLPAGAISHLNYAQKVAQIPMTMSMMLCTVTFPVVARALAEGDTERARARVERDLAVAAGLVLFGTAAVVSCAPQLIGLLFERGAFTPEDTAATADVMRVYALGLLGQTLTGVLVRSYFSAGRATWYPVAAMAAGIVATCCAGAWTVGPWGVTGIAAANAAGITVTAVLLLAGMGHRSVPVRTRHVLHELSRPFGAAVAAALAGGFVGGLPATPLAGLTAGGVTVTVVFVLAGRAPGAQGFASALRSVRTRTRKLAHALLR